MENPVSNCMLYNMYEIWKRMENKDFQNKLTQNEGYKVLYKENLTRRSIARLT